MHNKFLVFCKTLKGDEDGDREVIVPKSVWTGSFNFSKNATNSLENAVYIRDEKIAKAYFSEWSQIEGLSEPLDWESEWVAPEWRIGS